MEEYEPRTIESKWQRRWEEAKLYRTEADEDSESFYIIFAYPGISGFLHLGHMRCYSYTDFIARYKKMRGYNVLFPAGAHPTGNQVISLAKRVREDDPDIIAYLKANGATDEDILFLDNPDGIIEYFSRSYIKEWKNFGIQINWDHFTYTSREDYSKFIQWQFRKLKEKDLLTQKPYYAPVCKNCGPVAVDPSETDLSKGGNAEIQEYTLLKFKFGNRYITAATLRPETVYGQTNLWVSPEEDYAVVEVAGEEWIMSEAAAQKLLYQMDDVEVTDHIKGEEMIGEKATAPMIHRDIPILPADFTDPDVGSGIVTSVPSDAPYDWIALKELKDNHGLLEKYGLEDIVKDVEPIEIIESEGFGTNPAESIIKEMGITSQNEVEKLEEATQKIYRAGFHKGKMLDISGEYTGMPVQEAKDNIKDDMLDSGEADMFYDLSEEVICRCGTDVVMGKIPDQWFIRYSDEELTEKSKAHAKKMNIKPETYANTLPDTLEWFQDRSCARLGNWIGTRFPMDKRWIIEAIADSTLYPAYYIIAKHYNDDKFQADQMTVEFFDFVYLGKGEISQVSESTGIDIEVLEKVRNDFLYWYPLDINLGGKEHMTVHFPVFLMNHVSILKEEHWPRGILVNWYLTMTGGKISKSKGGAEPIPDVADRFGIDTLRLYYAHSASPFVDKEWDEKEAFTYRKRLGFMWRLINRIKSADGGGSSVDDFLESRFNRLLEKAFSFMDDHEIRKAANVVFYDIPAELEWYFKRGGENSALLDRLGETLIKLTAPFTPHMADELGEMWDIEYVTEEQIPEVRQEAISDAAEGREEYLRSVLDDIRNILSIADVEGDTIHIYVTPSWKKEVLKKALTETEKGMGLMAVLSKELDVPPKKLSGFLRSVLEDIKKNRAAAVSAMALDEMKILQEDKSFIEREFEAEVNVHLASEDVYDPANRKDKAAPGKPAIYIE